MAYTANQETELRNGAPWNWEKAQEFGSKHGLSARSVVSKIKSLDLEYQKAEPVKKNGADTGPTKMQIIGFVRESLSLPPREGDATKAEWQKIWEHIA